MDQQHNSPLTLFYSYAHEDEALRNELEKHLHLLQRRGLITAWHDRQIVPGTDWAYAIDHHLNESSIILLLISSDFLASDYCYNIEMQHALERHQRGEARVIPIIVRPVDWQHSPFAHLQCLPRDGKPITEWVHRDAAFRDIAEGLRRTIEHQIGSAHSLSRRNYLQWLIGRNYYLDPRGTFQTQRQVQVKMEEVYISLMVQREETPGKADRLSLEEELTNLETQLASSHITAEEIEDQREHILAQFESNHSTNQPIEVLELAEAVTHHDRIVILGDPGSGKTTLLRYLALKHAQALWQGQQEERKDLGNDLFPIFIRLAEYAENGIWKRQSLGNFLAEYHSLHECPSYGLTDLLQSELNKGNCLILLDGLDEIVSSDERRGVVQRVEDFVRHHSNTTNHFVITSRIVGYRSSPLDPSFSHYTVREMNETQIHIFLENWCQAVEDAQTPEISFQQRRNIAKRERDGIMRAVRTSPGVRRLAANPLLLRVLALIHRTGAQLPQKRIELYKLAADTLARTWRTAQGVPESALVDDSYLTRLLSKLAHWLHEHKSTGVATEQEVYNVLGQEWARLKGTAWDGDNPDIESEVKKFLQAVREHTGLFVERAPKRYGFMHLTFEEYYTSRYLVARSKTRAQLIRQHLHDSRWEEPILLGLGVVGLDAPEDATELLETAILAQGEDAQSLGFAPSDYEDILGRDYLFALRCLGDDIPADMGIVTKLMERLAEELLYKNGRAAFSRYQEALEDELSCLHNSKAEAVLLPYLFDALKEHDGDTSISAAHCLVQLDDTSEEVVSVLLKALIHNDSNVRRHAAWRLGSLKQVSSEVANALLQALTDDDSDVRYASAQRLRHLSRTSDEIVAALISTLLNSTHDIARFFAAQCLGGSGKKSDEVVRAMTHTLFNDADISVRATAAEGLGRLDQGSRVVSNLLQALNDNNYISRSSAVQCLGRLGYASTEVVTALISFLKDKESNMRLQAIQSLRNLERKSPQISSIVVTALLSSLKDKSAIVRMVAAQSLGQSSQEAGQEVAIQLRALTTKADSVGFEAVVALGKLGKEVSQDKVLILLNELHAGRNMITRREAAYTLGQLTQVDRTVICTLLDGLLDDMWIVRAASAESLTRLGQRFQNMRATIEEELIQAINDPKFDKIDEKKRSAHDYAFQAIWDLVIEQEVTTQVSRGRIWTKLID